MTAAVVTVAGLCAAGAAQSGPLSAATGALLSVPAPGCGPVTVSDVLPNSGPATVTIDHVRLQEADRVTLVDAYLVPTTGDGPGSLGFMMGGPFPPRFEDGFPELELAWDRRVDAIGAQIPPGETRVLVLGLRQTAIGTSTIGGVHVAYSEPGRSYTVTSGLRVKLWSSTGSCDA